MTPNSQPIPRIDIMDTTLRDGEQTDGVSFSTFEKLQIARLLLEKLNVDRIEVASARVSPGEHETVKEIFAWADQHGYGERIEILGFIDHTRSVDWIREAGGRAVNFLAKGSRRHCEQQLKKDLATHLKEIETSVQYAHDQGCSVNIYLEDWSNGFLNSPDYVHEMVRVLLQLPVRRLLLPDTLGILMPDEVKAGIGSLLDAFPHLVADFHGHNDYGLATANCIAAVQAGAKGIHTAVNGMGERAGNSPLETVVTALHDKLGVQTGINEKAITDASRLVETFSGKRVAPNRPVVGQDVYTQTAGIHADGDKKNNLYHNPILPERFGRERVYALGKLAGRASVSNNLKLLGIELSPERELQLLERIKELGEQKKSITADDLPFLIEDLFGGRTGLSREVHIEKAEVVTRLGEPPIARVQLLYFGKQFGADATGDGGYDAFMNALRKIGKELKLEIPRLRDYEVRIPPGGKTDALVETVITWDGQGERNFRTVGVDSDQVVAAIKATEKMLNRIVNRERTAGESPSPATQS